MDTLLTLLPVLGLFIGFILGWHFAKTGEDR